MEHVISSRLFFAVSLKLLATENSSDCEACTRLREFSLLVAEILRVLSQAFKLYVFPLPRGFLAQSSVRVRDPESLFLFLALEVQAIYSGGGEIKW